jgi:hypothetical protein
MLIFHSFLFYRSLFYYEINLGDIYPDTGGILYPLAFWDGIVSWKKSQINNGILEGLNSVLQAAKRKARGYKIQHFKTIAYLLTGKLDFSKIN